MNTNLNDQKYLLGRETGFIELDGRETGFIGRETGFINTEITQVIDN